MRMKAIPLLCTIGLCTSLFSPVYAGKSADNSVSESCTENENNLTHYEDDFVQFDYDENAGICISKSTGFGLIYYTFSDIYESAFSNSTSYVEILLNTQSRLSIDSAIDELSKYDEFQSLDDTDRSFSYIYNDLFVNAFFHEITDEYYMVTRYYFSDEEDAISSDLSNIVESFTVNDKLPPEIPTDRSKSLICAWYYTPEDWILEDVQSAIDICKQYRDLKIDLSTATKQVQEINSLLQKTSASSLISAALSALKSNTADLSDAIYLMQQFLDKQITSTTSLTRSSKIK